MTKSTVSNRFHDEQNDVQLSRARHVVITGGSSGIGHAVALRFQAAGWVIHNLSRRPSGIEGVHDVAVDLSDLPAVERAAEQLREALRGADQISVVHSAAVMLSDSLQTITTEQMHYAINLNIASPILLTARLTPALTAAPVGASIIYVGSTLSEKAVAGRLSYVTSKHAMVGMMRATCQDLFGSRVHTACVCPGFTDTEMLHPGFAANPSVRDAIVSMVSFKRLINPDEIARVIAFVAENPALNGAVLHANLGQREM